MIGRLRGEIAAVGADSLVIDVQGVGYVCAASTALLSRLRAGDSATLHVETQMSENAIRLFAFDSDDARAWFVRLQDVPGVGAKAAMAVLDAIGVSGLMDAVALSDAASVARAKGVGKKLAERITGELAGKAPPLGRFGALDSNPSAATTAPTASGVRAEAVSALVNLGYPQLDAARAVAASGGGDESTVEDLIKSALKELMV
ncbi:MAG: Holliday junction branch migration protein RuvA [Pseudomonadota bacterium]